MNAILSGADTTPLKYICVGTGRDGTQSLAKIIQSVFAHEGKGHWAHHEYATMDFYRAFCDFHETGDQNHLDATDALLRQCPSACIVGNGYAPLLDRFAAKLPAPVRLIHLQRRSMHDWLRSIMTDAGDFPEGYYYYSSSDPQHMKRMAAFHFGEMTRAQWDALPLEDKFRWYYQKTHALINQHKHLFDGYLHIYTEDLSREETRKAISNFVNVPSYLPPMAHLNRNIINMDGLSRDERAMLQWYFRNMDYHAAAQDPVAFSLIALNHCSRWLRYQVEGDEKNELYWVEKRSAPEMQSLLQTLQVRLRDALREVNDMIVPECRTKRADKHGV